MLNRNVDAQDVVAYASGGIMMMVMMAQVVTCPLIP
jgi:hypothetical protein